MRQARLEQLSSGSENDDADDAEEGQNPSLQVWHDELLEEINKLPAGKGCGP